MKSNNSFINNKKSNQILIAIFVIAVSLATIAISVFAWNSNKKQEPTQPTALSTKPQTTAKPQIISEEMKAKYDYNNDVIGWLIIPGTDINEEVLQSDDNDYYLRRTIDKASSVWGCYFVDYKCNVTSKKDLSRVTVIYGHSLKDYSDGKKFTQLKRYNDIEFCKENQIITFSLLYEKLNFQIFSISKMPITFYYIESEPTDEKFGEVLAKLYETNINYFPEVRVEKDDKILLLQTCTSDMNYRFIVAAKLIEE